MVTRTPRCAVLVVNFNAAEWIERCLDSVFQQSAQPHEVVVVDNASSDGSDLLIAQRYPAVHLIRSSTNLGFAAGCNLGLATIRCLDVELVATLNPDAMAAPDWLERLFYAAETLPATAMFASRMMMYGEPDRIDGLGDSYHCSGLAWRRRHGRLLGSKALQDQPVFGPCAGAALYRFAAIDAVGAFDERFFCYLEDVDLAFRLRLQGSDCRLISAAIVYHVGSYATGYRSDFATYYGHRNLLWLWLKNMPLPLLLLTAPLHLLAQLALLLVAIRRGQLAVTLKARVDAVRGFTLVLQRRVAVQRLRRVSSLDIWRALSKSFWPRR